MFTGIGREVEVHSRVQQLKASVWLAEGYPLSLQEQILPVIELMVGVMVLRVLCNGVSLLVYIRCTFC